ncbi:hypothetical protein Pcinc_014632 [Petrolisthes cinctipes]|uniref:Uncharacterized protein n=1 Tax=Petrolisthes cinctipes TaxID=88211 RepID=A0AAE1FXE1_PETCI|nr:hypothetical protein Pcinc_014632 [Petrolisthes cinctipes]
MRKENYAGVKVVGSGKEERYRVSKGESRHVRGKRNEKKKVGGGGGGGVRQGGGEKVREIGMGREWKAEKSNGGTEAEKDYVLSMG